MQKITIRVVETMADTHKGTEFPSFFAAIEWVAGRMVALTGGATIDPVGTGMWRDASGDLVVERGSNIWTLTDNPDAIDALRGVAQQAAQLGKQDCVLFTVESVQAEFVTAQ